MRAEVSLRKTSQQRIWTEPSRLEVFGAGPQKEVQQRERDRHGEAGELQDKEREAAGEKGRRPRPTHVWCCCSHKETVASVQMVTFTFRVKIKSQKYYHACVLFFPMICLSSSRELPAQYKFIHASQKNHNNHHNN